MQSFEEARHAGSSCILLSLPSLEGYDSIEEWSRLDYFNDMDTQNGKNWKYLAPKPGSSSKQLFIKGRKIAARTLYGAFMSEESPQTPEEIAEDWDVPLDAVLEAIAYCQTDPPEVREDIARAEALERKLILENAHYYFPGVEEIRARLQSEENKSSNP
jgi:uncharacterized protein (DUF433 family)